MRHSTKTLCLFGVAAALGCSRKFEGAASAPSPGYPAPAEAPMAFASASPVAAADSEKKESQTGDNGKPVPTWRHAGAAVHATEIEVGDKEKLPLRGMQIHVDVDGSRARVVVDGYFENDRDRQYEGTFKLRLPNDATPYYFAFGETVFTRAESAPIATSRLPNGVKYFSAAEERKMKTTPESIRAERQATFRTLKEARMVPREKAALAYTETTRRGADPALLEWAGAGVFNARVFPLAPHAIHRVVIAYDMPLTRAGDDLEYRLEVPQTEATLLVDVSSALPPDAGQGPAFVRDDARAYAHLEGKDAHAFTLRFKHPMPLTLAGDDPGVGKSFYTLARADLPVQAASNGSDTGLFVVDTSLSSNPVRFNVYEKLVAATLENNRASMKRFAVLFFDVTPRWYRPSFLDNTAENARALILAMDNLSLEGATDLGATLDEAAHPAWLRGDAASRWDTFLLSDGAPTWGESDEHAISRAFEGAHRGAVFAYNTGIAGTETGMLASLARATGGSVFSVVGEEEIAAASTAHKARAWTIAAVRAKAATDLVLAGRPVALFPGQTIAVAGRGVPEGPVEIDVEQGNEKRTLTIPTTRAIPSALAARAYGEIATSALEDLAPETDQASRAYAVHYRVTGKTASLLMLESEADYQRFGIRDEDETARVAQTLATTEVARADRAVGETLGDPKVAFLRWLDTLGARSGVAVDVPKETRGALESLPREAFAVKPAPLDMHVLTHDAIASDLREALSHPGSLEYDRVSREAEERRIKYGPADALRALSSLVEQSPGDAVLARDVAFTTMSMRLDAHAFHLLRRVGAARPWEPQTYRAMAQAAANMGNADLALGYWEASLAGKWDSRFGEFHRIAAVDYVHLLRRIQKGELKTRLGGFAATRLKDLSDEVALSGADLVVMITWNTDNSDVDLHVTEPSGEECFYSHRHTASGGELTQDVTQGYGPEMYVERRAPRGAYQIRAHYFASQRSRETARTKVYAHVIENWGRADERITEGVVTLEEGKEMHDILTVKR